MYIFIQAFVCSAFLNGCRELTPDGSIDFGRHATRTECQVAMRTRIFADLTRMRHIGPARVGVSCMTEAERKEAEEKSKQEGLLGA